MIKSARAAFVWFLGPLCALTGLTAPAAPRVLWTNSTLHGSPEPPPPYTVERTFTNLTWKLPMYVIPEPGTDQLWVVLQGGEVDRPSRVFRIPDQAQTDQKTQILQLSNRLIYALTFHPGYRTNRAVFLFSNGPTGAGERTNRISRLHVASEAPFGCDLASEHIVLEWRSAGHDGGDLAFGRDGMLYFTSGDGTSDSDGWDSGQDMTRLLAKLIRIDVDHAPAGRTYAVPEDNPFRSTPGARPETWAYGFRNPWRMSIDQATGDIWVGNNGQDLWETAYLVRRGDNYGWSVTEGSHPFHARRRSGPTPIVRPIIEHSHAEFRSLTGGVVYHGDQLLELDGTYIYGDYTTGRIWGARHREGRLVWHRELAATSLQIAAFRVDLHGALLVVDHAGGIYRLVPRRPSGPPRTFPTRLSETGLFASMAEARMAPGLVPYAVNAPGWADGAQADRFIALPADDRIQYSSARGWNFSNDTALVQTLWFEGKAGRPGRRRLETRVLLKQDGEWAGYSYWWNDAQDEATLVPKEGQDLMLSAERTGESGPPKAWRAPSRAECLACHARAANFVLGLSELQLNRDFDYGQGAGPENQLAALKAMKLFNGPPKEKPETLPRLVDPYDVREDLGRRARSYLHANCSVCHIEAGGGNSRMELEFSRKDAEMNVFGMRPQHDTFGLANAMVIAPGDPDNSVLYQRVSRRGPGQMPPLMTHQVDTRAAALFRDWIKSLKPAETFVREWTMADLLPALPALPALASGRSLQAGQAIFTRVGCIQCHRMDGKGGAVGPELTGIGRRLDRRAVLEAMVEPSKVIADEYASYEIERRSGEVLTGQIEREDDRELVLRTASAVGESVHVAKTDIQRRTKSAISNMPAGILNVLTKEEILDLLAYVSRTVE
jgi:uncharacterized repeat protein (TIGR03806 family)